jgi:hypothetical protein
VGFAGTLPRTPRPVRGRQFPLEQGHGR